jgi:hypothetical protein
MADSNDDLVGRRIRSLKPDVDRDEDDCERKVPAGSFGTISRFNHVSADGGSVYDVFWDNGAWTIYSQSEVDEHLELIVD